MKRRFVTVMVCVALMVTMLAVPVNASASSVVKIMKINVSGAHLRDKNDLTVVIGSLKKGAKVLYNGQTKKAFCLVKTTGGDVGYVYKHFLSSYGAVNTSQIYYTTTSTKVYKKASTKSSGKKVGKHEYVLVYETRGNWAYVKTMSGKGGYMKTSVLAKA